MKSFETKEVLRLNCPGYGEKSTLSMVGARPLDDFRVIIANPVSILHLFGGDAETLEQIEAAQSEGLTSMCLPDDALLKSISDVAASRTEEIFKFLEKGGLLIYFLCRPFVLQGPSISLDNYMWLLSLAPDQPGEKNIRHMSSVTQGRDIEVCEQASASEFSKYFSQSGLEWTTIIRSEFMTEGYNTLAMAGTKKCIAAELYAGENGGKIVFLPARYSPDFDTSLTECVQLWHEGKQTNGADSKLEGELNANRSSTASEAIEAVSAPPASIAEETAPPTVENETDSEESKQEMAAAMVSPEQQAERFLKEKALKSTSELGIAFVDITKQLEQEAKGQGISQGIGSAAKHLVKALEKSATSNENGAKPEGQLLGSQGVSSWCRLYTLPGLESLYKEKDALILQIEKEQTRVNSIQECLAKVEDLKNHLLGSSGDSLKEACTRALKRLGWTITQSTMHKEEIWLAVDEQPEAIARIVESDSKLERAHLAQLAESVIMFWEHHEHEPKGLLIACTWRGTAFTDRKEPDFSDTLIEFAKKKNIGLITTHQLLCTYRDIELGKVSAEQIRQEFFTTCGALLDSAAMVEEKV
jgi:hypothetical protein